VQTGRLAVVGNVLRHGPDTPPSTPLFGLGGDGPLELLLQEADAIVEIAHTERDPLAGQLRVALIPTVGPYLLPHVARRLQRALPRLKLLLLLFLPVLLLVQLVLLLV
jgi:hypothetical protein